MITNNTTITIDLSKEIIPATFIAAIHGKAETTAQARARVELERKLRAEQWEVDTRVNLNAQLIEKGYAILRVDESVNCDRGEIVKICKKFRREFEAKGFTVGGWGEYSLSNTKIYELFIQV